MALHPARLDELVSISEIRSMSIECSNQGGINLAQGICDLEVPSGIIKGAKQAMDQGFNIYTPYSGLPELKEAIARKHEMFSGIRANPAAEIVVSCGATGAMYCTCLALLDPGDEVIVFEPYYGYHINTLLSINVRPTYVRLEAPSWRFSRQDIEKRITEKTRAIIVNTPSNPSGKVFTGEELEIIADLAIKHDLFVFTDEIYEHFVYNNARHIPPSTLPGMKERTITISGLSKTFSITGWRIGYCICDEKWAKTIGYINDLIYVCAPAPLQIGVARGLMELDEGYYRKLALDHAKKRDMILNALEDAHMHPCMPQGAYYVLADISRIPGKDSIERTRFFLDQTGIACIPGKAFYHDDAGDTLARFCFAKQDDVLEEACRRIKGFTL